MEDYVETTYVPDRYGNEYFGNLQDEFEDTVAEDYSGLKKVRILLEDAAPDYRNLRNFM